MPTAEAPIKVYPATKEKVRYAAAMTGRKQVEIVELAVEEYIERRKELFADSIERARVALATSKHHAVAHAMGIEAEEVDKIAGGPTTERF